MPSATVAATASISADNRLATSTMPSYTGQPPTDAGAAPSESARPAGHRAGEHRGTHRCSACGRAVPAGKQRYCFWECAKPALTSAGSRPQLLGELRGVTKRERWRSRVDDRACTADKGVDVRNE